MKIYKIKKEGTVVRRSKLGVMKTITIDSTLTQEELKYYYKIVPDYIEEVEEVKEKTKKKINKKEDTDEKETN